MNIKIIHSLSIGHTDFRLPSADEINVDVLVFPGLCRV